MFRGFVFWFLLVSSGDGVVPRGFVFLGVTKMAISVYRNFWRGSLLKLFHKDLRLE